MSYQETGKTFLNFYKPEKYPSPVKPPKHNKKSQSHRLVIYDKTGFKIEGNTIRLRLSKDLKEQPKTDKALAIDYGVTNFATIVVEGEKTSYIVDGKGIQSILRKYLKKLGR